MSISILLSFANAKGNIVRSTIILNAIALI